MNKEFLEQIKTRREKLEEVKIVLKEKFIGIDSVIDKIIDNISLWYQTPELQFRPLIISLWGITGVGKTDLVRTLVKELNYTDKFIEIQMDLKNDYAKNIENYLDNSGIDSNEPAILLLDEIQRYRAIDETGRMIENKYFNDIWMLLSDGKFQNNSQRRAEIVEMLMDELYWLDYRENTEEEIDSDTPSNADDDKKQKKIKNPKKRRFQTSYWTASKFKKMLNLKISTEEIMEMNLEQRLEIMEENLKAGNVNEGKSYEKLLIFISGNLDEAFRMSEEVEEVERDADVFHELSKRINIIHIKNALAYKFKPEQIARFGNNHIIYPCLDKKSYQIIIKKNAKQVLDKIKSQHDIEVELDSSVYDVIYRNGVFPTQGVRPAISTVYNILGTNLPFFMYHAMLNDVNKFNLRCENKKLITDINGKTIQKDLVLDIDDIRDGKSLDEKMLVIVHELGHALIYALLFKTPPKQININSAGLENGFVINHSSIDNKTFIRNQIAILLSGIVAEELVFGEEFKSNGSSHDILIATDIAGKYVRWYGMSEYVSRISKENVQMPHDMNYDIDKTNETIEIILSEEKKRSKDLLNKHMGLYKELIRNTINKNMIPIDLFVEICNRFGLTLIEKGVNDKIIYSYDEKIQNFLNQ
jgi:cell division protease FtsH